MYLEDFRIRYPQFRTAGDELVQACLDDAEMRVSEDTFGTRFDQAHGLKAAHLLAISPYGRSQRLASNDGESIYQEQLDKLTLEVAPRIIVL